MGLWAKASKARRTGRGVLFIGPPWSPEAHFIGDLQHRVSPEASFSSLRLCCSVAIVWETSACSKIGGQTWWEFFWYVSLYALSKAFRFG